jgi:C1A family cysteine protease
MDTDFVPKDYEKKLKASRPIVAYDQQKVKSGLKLTKEDVIVYPPLNTDIVFTVPIEPPLPPTKLKSATVSLPENFTWRPKISPIQSQGLCGSCWAFAVAHCLNDRLLIKTKKNYNISPAYMLTCYPACRNPSKGCPPPNRQFPNSYMCGGGNPASLAEWIASFGTTVSNCVSYSICSGNSLCNGQSTQHFGTPFEKLNELFPTCGCNPPGTSYPRIFIKKGTVRNNVLPQSRQNDTFGINSLQVTVKQHMFTNGPCIGGYHVLSNFMTGLAGAPAFGKTFAHPTKNPFGVYLDMVNYTTHTRMTKRPIWVGAHAINIVGWGMAKVDASLIDPILARGRTGMISVPYWECKNSWGTNWNDRGYFKIAMYPFNRFAQFEVQIPVDGKYSGGIVTFDMGDIVNTSSFPKNNAKTTLKTPPYDTEEESGEINIDDILADENIIVEPPVVEPPVEEPPVVEPPVEEEPPVNIGDTMVRFIEQYQTPFAGILILILLVVLYRIFKK